MIDDTEVEITCQNAIRVSMRVFDLFLMNQTVARRDIDCKGRDGVVCYARPLLSA